MPLPRHQQGAEACHVTGQRSGKYDKVEANNKHVTDNTEQALGKEGGNEFTWDGQRSSVSASVATHIVLKPVDLWWGFSPAVKVCSLQEAVDVQIMALIFRPSSLAQNLPEVALPPDLAGNMQSSSTSHPDVLEFEKKGGSKVEEAM